MRFLIVSLAFLTAAAAGAQTPPAIRGFPTGQSERQRDMEQHARRLPQPGKARDWLRAMTSKPHHAGSAGSREVAGYTADLFRQWGYETRVEESEALLPYPESRHLEMIEPVKFVAALREPVLPDDPDSGDPGQLATYNAYGADGDVTGSVVYVNYGIPEDYQTLRQLGIEVKGRIVIARYGRSWRGTKVKVAKENGAAGCILYSDPRDDGYFQGDVFPKGPFRPSRSAQRGSVMDMPLYVGDPLSPGWASEKGSRRLAHAEAATLMRIPVLPISYEDASPILVNLGGPVAPEEWRGALPFTYHVGPGPATVRLRVKSDWQTRPLYNVIAVMRGVGRPGEWIVHGNHHDAWVHGANDPASGAAALLETARALSELRKSGWNPSRTILFALWDGEEFGLVGSTEWVEKHKEELERHVAAYLNTDSNSNGAFHGSGSPILEEFFRQVMRDLRPPGGEKSLLETPAPAGPPSSKPRESQPPVFNGLGAGSDYVAFLHHAGIPSLNFGFGSAGGSGTYHSVYDSYTWFTRHIDRDFLYSNALSQFTVTALLRLSESTVMPHGFLAVPAFLRRAADEIEKIAAAKNQKVDFQPLFGEMEMMSALAGDYEKKAALAMQLPADPGRDHWQELNGLLVQSERKLTLPEGLAGRPWYKHPLYAPGLYTGYSARLLPGVREAVDAGNWEEAARQVKLLAGVASEFNRHLREVLAALDRRLAGSTGQGSSPRP